MRAPALRSRNLVLAAAAAAALIVEGILRAHDALPPGAYVLACAVALPLVWRTRALLAALAGVEAGALACAWRSTRVMPPPR